jgi:hypothetical protein
VIEALFVNFPRTRGLGQASGNVGPIVEKVAQRKGWLDGVGQLVKSKEELSPPTSG